MNEEIISVSEYIGVINERLNSLEVKIMGEVSDMQISSSGHVYFYLKDEEDESVVKCVIWGFRYKMYDVELKEGLKIIVSGKSNLHKKYGFSFIAETIEYAGEGKLKKEYEKLKLKLKKEGLFDKKRELPSFPSRIGVITSLKGAVIADFLNNLGKFGFKIEAIDSKVEGQAAVEELFSSIQTFKKRKIDVLVIIRGGGSLESLMAFNNENLTREIANFPVPVIAGIGHDKDIPLSSLASDIYVSTPTAAANKINQSWEEALFKIEKKERIIFEEYNRNLNDCFLFLENSNRIVKNYFDSIFEEYKKNENQLKSSLNNFQNSLFNAKVNLDNLIKKSFSEFQNSLVKLNNKLEYIERIVSSHNPENQLRLGYTIARCKERIVRKISDVKKGDNLDLKVFDGEIITNVKKIKNDKRK